MRDIAKDAGVSLTLLDHYFGSKAMLLQAVVGAHRDECQRRIAPLKASLSRTDVRLSLDRLINEWTDYEFDLSVTRQGRHNLNLTMRLSVDAEVDPVLRTKVNCSEQVFIDAYGLVRPELDDVEVNGAWVLASAALYDAVLNVDGLHGSSLCADTTGFRHETKRFVTNGLRDWYRAA